MTPEQHIRHSTALIGGDRTTPPPAPRASPLHLPLNVPSFSLPTHTHTHTHSKHDGLPACPSRFDHVFATHTRPQRAHKPHDASCRRGGLIWTHKQTKLRPLVSLNAMRFDWLGSKTSGRIHFQEKRLSGKPATKPHSVSAEGGTFHWKGPPGPPGVRRNAGFFTPETAC